MEVSLRVCFVPIVLIQLLYNIIAESEQTVTKRRAIEEEGGHWFPTPKPQTEFYAIDFEVTGKVQGKDIMFKECMKEKAERLKNVRGWVFDTPYGTVKGHIQTTEFNLILMKHWLRFGGSPTCFVEKANFANHLKMKNYTMSDDFIIID